MAALASPLESLASLHGWLARCILPCLLCIFLAPQDKDQLTVKIWIYYCVEYSVSLVYMYVFMLTSYYFDHYSYSSGSNLKLGSIMTLTFSSYCGCLGFSGSL